MVYSSLIVKKMHCVWAFFAYLDTEECEQLPDNIIFIQSNIEYNEENATFAVWFIHAYTPFIFSLYEMQTFIVL